MFQDIPIINQPSLLLVPAYVQKYIDEKSKLIINKGSANTAEKIGILTGYDTIITPKNCGGYCDRWNREIAINFNELPVILHEVCHVLQSDLGIWDKTQPLLSDFFKFEQQCESMAMAMYKNITGEWSPDLFNSYFDRHSLDFLRDWYEGSYITNDICF
jgi:hypothetical protein